MEISIPNADAALQAAPILILRRIAKSQLLMANDLRLINVAIVKQSCPMPHLDSEVNHFSEPPCFFVVKFLLWILVVACAQTVEQGLLHCLT